MGFPQHHLSGGVRQETAKLTMDMKTKGPLARKDNLWEESVLNQPPGGG